MVKFFFINVVCFICIPCFSQQHKSRSVILTFKNMVGENILHQDSLYSNAFDETFTVHQFKYYISNIVLIDSAAGKKQFIKNQYYLIDAFSPEKNNITLKVELPQVTAVQFMIGVDSLKNVRGVQTGSLDPLQGMFWTWNSGYIMAKLEGISPAAKMPGHRFSLDIGGYKAGENSMRKIALKNLSPQATQIIIAADILKWFKSIHSIKIADIAFVHEPGTKAMLIADNYATMFSLQGK